MIKNSIIDVWMEASAPKEQICTICGVKYTGHRIICESKRCFWALQTRITENRNGRPLDYVSQARKTFIFEFPSCKICNEEYIGSLEDHCKEIDDEEHLVLLVHNK